MRHASCFYMRSLSLFLLVALLPSQVAAQNAPASAADADAASRQTSGNSAEDFENLPVPSWGKAIIDSFSKPVHPIVGGVASGGGLGMGVGYDSPDDARWYREVETMLTVRRYWTVEGEIGRRSASRRTQLGVFGAMRHMNRINFFGIGPATTYDARANFRLRETTFGMRGWHQLTPIVKLGGGAAMYYPDLGRGANPNVPSIHDAFLESAIPGGFSAQPTFSRYRGFAEFVYPIAGPEATDDSGGYRGAYQMVLESVRDHDEGLHNFHRWEAEVQQRIPGLFAGQRLTLHGFAATTNSDGNVPFYMLYTLGGSGGLKAYRPDLLGSDGTRSTLRGYRNYRFRDRDLVLMQAEYRIPLHRSIHSTVFVDSGQVAPRRSELFTDLRTTTGFSLSYMRNGKTVGRMDVGFGGGEGVEVFWSFGAFD
jgi:hypothetical protein